MTLDEYQEQAVATATYPADQAITYPILGLNGEAGEVADKWKKYLRGDSFARVKLDEDGRRRAAEYEVARELGDAMWYIAALARDLGFTLEEIATSNLSKLRDRRARGVVKGSGDDR